MPASFRLGALPLRTLVLCLSLFAPVNALPAATSPGWQSARSLSDLVSQLETWLDVHSDLPRNAAPPVIRRVHRSELAEVSARRGARHAGLTRGLYDPADGTIWLANPWNPRNPYHVSILLHELYHHRQAAHGHYYCPGAQELPAYRAQEAWLAASGGVLDVNWVAIVLESGCTPRDIHPD